LSKGLNLVKYQSSRAFSSEVGQVSTTVTEKLAQPKTARNTPKKLGWYGPLKK
jgi:hypothetical protein